MQQLRRLAREAQPQVREVRRPLSPFRPVHIRRQVILSPILDVQAASDCLELYVVRLEPNSIFESHPDVQPSLRALVGEPLRAVLVERGRDRVELLRVCRRKQSVRPTSAEIK